MASALGTRAYEGLFKKKPEQEITLSYSGRFKHYGANIKYTPNKIDLRLSKEYHEVGDEVRIGVIQHLLAKAYKHKERTIEMELYDTFLQKVGEYSTYKGARIEDEELEESFKRVNKEYFDGYLTTPNIEWGSHNKTRLGHYTFANDTVTLSTTLKGGGDVLDYVLYHELLHKKHKYEHKSGRTHSHTKAFRQDEKKFKTRDGEDPEKKLERWLRRRRGMLTRIFAKN